MPSRSVTEGPLSGDGTRIYVYYDDNNQMILHPVGAQELTPAVGLVTVSGIQFTSVPQR